jgi:hypothetical protein
LNRDYYGPEQEEEKETITFAPNNDFAPSTELPLSYSDDGLTQHHHDKTTIRSSISSDSLIIRQTSPLSPDLSLHIKNHPAPFITPSSSSSTSSSISSRYQDDASFQQKGSTHSKISKRDHDTSSESPIKIETQTTLQIIGSRRLRIPNWWIFGDDWVNASVSLTDSSCTILANVINQVSSSDPFFHSIEWECTYSLEYFGHQILENLAY